MDLRNHCIGLFGLMAAAIAICLPGITPAAAKVTYITKTCSFTLGDNDTKNEAREVSFVRCKRKVLEKAGSYIQQRIQVTNGRLTKEQVSMYAAAILSVEVVKERFFFKGNSMVLEQTVKAGVDLGEVRSRLAAIAGDRSVATKVENQHKQIKNLETRVEELRSALGVAQTSRAKEIRKEQNVVIGELDRLSKLKISIMNKINFGHEKVLKFIEPGMLASEVRALVGNPRRTWCGSWNYGRAWVIFDVGSNRGAVACIVGARRCYGERTSNSCRGRLK